MSEVREAAEELLKYFDKLGQKYGRVAEFKAAKPKIDRLRKALACTRVVRGRVDDHFGRDWNRSSEISIAEEVELDSGVWVEVKV